MKSLVGVIPVLAAIEVPTARTLPGTRLRKRFADFLSRRGIDEANLDRSGFIQRIPGRDTGAAQHRRPRAAAPGAGRGARRGRHAVAVRHPVAVAAAPRRSRSRSSSTVRRFGIDYEPAESRTAMYGGNSNWRGPVWFPVNHLVVEALERYHGYLGDSFRVECPTGSGKRDDPRRGGRRAARRAWSRCSCPAPTGCRPTANVERFRTDPRWSEGISFFEYFDGDHGYGLGASHQTGWTALVADLILRRPSMRHRAPGPPDPELDERAARLHPRGEHPRVAARGVRAGRAGAHARRTCPTRSGTPVVLEHVDCVWLMGVWTRSPAGREVALANDALRQFVGRGAARLGPTPTSSARRTASGTTSATRSWAGARVWRPPVRRSPTAAHGCSSTSCRTTSPPTTR